LKRSELLMILLVTWHLVILNFHARSCFLFWKMDTKTWMSDLLLHARHSMFYEEMVLMSRWSHKGRPRYPSPLIKHKTSFYAISRWCSNTYYVLMQVNISLVVNDSEAKQCVQALHSAFFENGFLSEVEGADVPQNGASLNSNGAIYAN
jgi:hypothetical protein